MSANDTSEPSVAEADQRVERAKAALRARVERLKHKLGDARHQLDFAAQIAKHPLPAIGIALAVGALAAITTRPSAPGAATRTGEHSLTGAALGALAAFGLRIARELAIGQLGDAAKQWWVAAGDNRGPQAAGARTDLDPFREH